jgi:hypothetical protein
MARAVTLQRPNFHLTRDLDGPIDGFLEPNVPIEVLEEAPVDSYWHVRLTDGREGFIHVDHVHFTGEPERSPPPPAAVTSGVVEGGRPFFRSAPSPDSSFDGFLEIGTRLELLSQPNEYWHVRLTDGRTGFIHSVFVRQTVPGGPVPTGGDAATVTFSSAVEVDDWFRNRTGRSFIPWFNLVRAGNRFIAGTPQASSAFEALCNNLTLVFGQPANLNQLLCLVSVAAGETGGSLSPRPELVGRADLGAPGIAYAFNTLPQIPKTSYNVPPNRTAFDLFHDPLFVDRFADLPLAAELRHTQDERWAGVSYPLDVAPTSTDPALSGIILECDFYKFRGRGFIQTTWRSNYVRLIRFVQASTSTNPVMQRYREDWAGRDPHEIATTSTNAEWNELFEQTGYVVACAAILLHSQDHGNYLNVSPDVAVLSIDGDVAGSAFRFGFRVNGGRAYARDLRSRVIELRNHLG